MEKLHITLTALIILSITCLPTAGDAANSLHCQRGIVSLGDTKNEMITKCGTPTDYRKSWLNIEYLTYDFGPNRFIRTIKVIDGKVNRIKTGGYGGVYSK